MIKKLILLFTEISQINLENLLKQFVQIRGIEISFTFLDDGFYNFNNSSIPQFFNIK